MSLRTCHKATIAKDYLFNSSTGAKRTRASTRRFRGRGQMVSATSVLFASLLFSAGHLFVRPSNALGFGFEASRSDTLPSCAPVDVRGLDYCPQLIDILPTLMENKRALLRLASDALAGSGDEEPLHLVHVLARNTVDVMYSGIQEIAPSWNEGLPDDALLVDQIQKVYTEKLHRRRPVVIFVTREEVCSLADALSTPIQGATSSANTRDSAEVHVNYDPVGETQTGETDGEDRLSTIPVALMTLGWDKTGSPLYLSKYSDCSTTLLELPQVVQWFISHEKGNHARPPKVEYVGVGFGDTKTRSGLEQSVYIDATTAKLRKLEYCHDSEAGSMDLLFMCNNAAPRTARPAINEALDTPGHEAAKVVPMNRYPMEPEELVRATTEGFFAVSPAGTRPDGFRHYEYLLAGNIVYMTDHPSLRIIFADLPVVFVEGEPESWAEITCDVMKEHAIMVARRVEEALEPGSAGPAFRYDKLTLRYWEEFVRDRVWAAGAVYAGSSQGMETGRDRPLERNDVMAVGHV